MTAHSDAGDRFGIPDELIVEVIRAHSGIMRDGCYVPTRAEVAEASADKIGAGCWAGGGKALPN